MRAEGRDRSEIEDLNRRLQALDEDLRAETSDREFLFNVEAYASVILQRLRAEIFAKRLEMPKSDAEVFAILQRAGRFDLLEARRLRQFCEARTLSSRDLEKIDIVSVREMAKDREWIRGLLERFS